LSAENSNKIRELHYELLRSLSDSQKIVDEINNLYENAEYLGGGPKNFSGALAVLKTAVVVSTVEWENISFHRGE